MWHVVMAYLLAIGWAGVAVYMNSERLRLGRQVKRLEHDLDAVAHGRPPLWTKVSR